MPRDKKAKGTKGKRAKAKEEEPAAGTVSPPPASWTCEECGYEHEGDEAASMICLACDEPRPVATTDEEGLSSGSSASSFIKCALVLELEAMSGKLKALTLDVGEGAESAITVVTNAPNVAEGKRVVVATPGAVIATGGEEEIKVKKRNVDVYAVFSEIE
eukprot:UC1_evm2s2101